MHGKQVLTVLALSLPAVSVHAEVVATCDAPNGWAYYVPGRFVKPPNTGWVNDRIKDGGFQLIRAGDEWDVIITDATGATVSSKGDGARVVGFRTEDRDVVVQVSYKGYFETYVFWLSKEKPEMSVSQARVGFGYQKHSVMVAPCRRGG